VETQRGVGKQGNHNHKEAEMNARRATHYTPWRLRGLRSRMDAQYRSWPFGTRQLHTGSVSETLLSEDGTKWS